MVIQDPLIPAGLISPGQWQDGEEMADVKLHYRFDQPMDQIGANLRAWGEDLAYFRGTYIGASAANAIIPYVAQVDTAGGWNNTLHQYLIPATGVYLISAQVSIHAMVGQTGLNINDSGNANFPINGAPVDPPGPNGPHVSWIGRLPQNDAINITVTNTVDGGHSIQSCWLAIKLLTYG